MLYLFFFILAISIVYFSERVRCSDAANNVVLAFSVLFLSFLPALQFNVGTDYQTYYNITKDPVQIEIIFNKGEYLFYFFIKALSALGLHGQWIFVIHSILSSFLLVNVLRKLRDQGYIQWLVLFLVVFVTGLIHNQMNGLRNMLAVYFFLNAFVYKAGGQSSKSILFSVFGILSHQSFLAMTPFLLVPLSVYFHLFNYIRFYYLLFFIFFGSGVFVVFFDSFVRLFLPFYSHYLSLSFIGEGVGYVNVFTKIYYLPLHLLFLFLLGGISNRLTKFDKSILGFWVLGANLYLGLVFISGLFRAFHYVVFFGVFPVYFLLRHARLSNLSIVSIFLYLMLPYLLKVTVFKDGEYGYEFFFL
ncbi:MAG: hypothetical protein ACI92N_002949 [Pseudomonadales bacterium]